jgi:hypothetical protein
MTKVLVKSGYVRKIQVENMTFKMISGIKSGASGMWITVDPKSAQGENSHLIHELNANVIRVKIDSKSSFEFIGDAGGFDGSDMSDETDMEPVTPETDEEIMTRIRTRFSILDDMTNAAVDGLIKGLVVSGPPGVGKTYGIEKILEKAEMHAVITNSKAKYGVERGSATPISLYKLLYEYSEENSVLVLDDSDSILYDEVSLNLLKAVLDSGKKRRVAWRSETRALERDGVPDTFEFKGSVVFITNLKLEDTRGKIGDHMKALLSRCHYIDLEINNTREKFLRCKQIIKDGMLINKGFTYEQQNELLEFIYDNKDKFRELSLRMVSKVSDLYKMSPQRWKEYAENTCIRR